MDDIRLKPVFVKDDAGKPVAVQVDLASFRHVLELLEDALDMLILQIAKTEVPDYIDYENFRDQLLSQV